MTILKIIIAIFISLLISFCISLFRRRKIRKDLFSVCVEIHLFLLAEYKIAQENLKHNQPVKLSENFLMLFLVSIPEKSMKQVLWNHYVYLWHKWGNKGVPPYDSKCHKVFYTIYEDEKLYNLFFDNYEKTLFLSSFFGLGGEKKVTFSFEGCEQTQSEFVRSELNKFKNMSINEKRKELQQVIYDK